MNLVAALATFLIILPAELPDKTMISAVILGTKYRPLLIWLGASTAFLLHVVIAITLGNLITKLPHIWVESIVSAVFLAGGLYLLLSSEKNEAHEGIELVQEEIPRIHRIFFLAFSVIFVGEFGDLTQIMVINLAAKYHSPLSVGLGAFLALSLVGAIGAYGGKTIVRIVPLGRVRKVAGVVLVLFALYTFLATVKVI